MDQSGVNWDVTAVGFGIRGATLEPIVERFEGEVQNFGAFRENSGLKVNNLQISLSCMLERPPMPA